MCKFKKCVYQSVASLLIQYKHVKTVITRDYREELAQKDLKSIDIVCHCCEVANNIKKAKKLRVLPKKTGDIKI